jgi:3-dehydrosphinganine reductase
VAGGEMSDYENKLVLIPGGSSGLGLALGKRLARFGSSVWILSRDPQKLASAYEEIKACSINSNQRFGMLKADVCDYAQLQAVISEFINQVGVPDILLNSAGKAIPGHFDEQEVEVFQEMMDLNFFGTLYSIKAVLPGMLKRRSGTIVNISSMAGYAGVYGYSAYGSAKYAIAGLTDTIRSELKPKGIKVFIVYPPTMDTPGLVKENQVKPLDVKLLEGDNAKVMSPEEVAEIVLKDVARGRYMSFPGFDSKFYFQLKRISGNLAYPITDWFVSGAIKKAQKISKDSQSSPYSGADLSK